MSTFKIGDVVQLKSGSPPMTINACYENNIFVCAWFDKANIKQSTSFNGGTLEIFNEEGEVYTGED